LLLCAACLNPKNSFQSFDKEQFIKLTSFYPNEFSSSILLTLPNQLENFIADVQIMHEFFYLKGMSELARTMIETSVVTKPDRVRPDPSDPWP
jgi:hypothetical protein